MNFGNSFHGCLDYITGRYDEDKHTKILAHSDGIPDMDNKTIAQIFHAYSQKGNHDIKSPVGHFAYSFHKNDASRMTDELMTKIVKEHMQMLGIKDTEWIIGRHYDTDHEHAHLMFSMVDKHGKVIDDSMIYERNKRICNYLNKKYGLTMTSDKSQVNRSKLRGKERMKYDFYDKVMKCKLQSSSWASFEQALRAEGLKLSFHYNNVTGKLLGVTFTDGKYSFGGKQLDESLKLNSLIKDFGDLKKMAHEVEREWYEQYKKEHSSDIVNGSKRTFPDFDQMFPNVKNLNFKYMTAENLMSQLEKRHLEDVSFEHTISEDGKTGFISFDLLFAMLLQPYHDQITSGGGNINNRGWRDDDEEEMERKRNQSIVSKPAGSKPAYKPRKR